MNQSTGSHLLIFRSIKNMANWLIFISVNERAQCKKNACWVFETVRIILIIISLICFTEKVYGSIPYSPNTYLISYKLNKYKFNSNLYLFFFFSIKNDEFFSIKKKKLSIL